MSPRINGVMNKLEANSRHIHLSVRITSVASANSSGFTRTESRALWRKILSKAPVELRATWHSEEICSFELLGVLHGVGVIGRKTYIYRTQTYFESLLPVINQNLFPAGSAGNDGSCVPTLLVGPIGHLLASWILNGKWWLDPVATDTKIVTFDFCFGC